MNHDSPLVVGLVGLLYPFMVLLAAYVVLNGHMTPGGGFQGGAILASITISRYLAYPFADIRTDILEKLEKGLFAGILMLAILLLFLRPGLLQPPYDQLYLIALNILIGLKVGAGLTIIFYRFIFYEGGTP